MNEEDLKQFLEANKEEVQHAVRSRLIEGLLANHKWTMAEQIGTVVSDFMRDEIMPEVKKHLISEKSAIIDAAISSASQISEILATSMVERAAKNIRSDSYQFREMMKSIFN